MSGIVLGTTNTSIKMTDNIPAFMDSTSIGERYTINKQKISSSIRAIKETKSV